MTSIGTDCPQSRGISPYNKTPYYIKIHNGLFQLALFQQQMALLSKNFRHFLHKSDQLVFSIVETDTCVQMFVEVTSIKYGYLSV